ncbi:dihydrofolate reductase family protein [Kribbella deserti]|uniref:Dihydrofolate reductase family protein n=1 Tax=Kribbella deserti TaxID=1926257 RepID=A0ABV6QP13_9ACTN
MRKLIESTYVTLDGTINEPQNWSLKYFDDEYANYAGELLFGADALVLGRETYEGFAPAWMSRSGDPFTDRINEMPKHVASTTLTGDLEWNSTVLPGDAVEAVRDLKAQDGKNLMKYGTGSFSKALLAANLVDEFHFWVFPVIAGRGDRLFDGLDTTHLQHLGSTTFKSGVVVHKLGPKS